MAVDFDKYFKNYVYEPIALCACYEPMVFPLAGQWDEPQNPFHDTIERRIGNTWYISSEQSVTDARR